MSVIERGRVRATTESGQIHTIVFRQDVVRSRNLSGGNKRILGLVDLETDDGQPVNRRKPGEYELVLTGEILTGIDPEPSIT